MKIKELRRKVNGDKGHLKVSPGSKVHQLSHHVKPSAYMSVQTRLENINKTIKFPEIMLNIANASQIYKI